LRLLPLPAQQLDRVQARQLPAHAYRQPVQPQCH
jgi:hypothetical protein